MSIGGTVAGLLLLLMGGLWGLQFAMLKRAAGIGLSEISVLMVALLLLSVIFAALLLVRDGMFRLSLERIRFLAIIGLLGYVFPLLAALYAAPHLPAGILTLIATSAPVATIVTVLLLRSESVSPRRLVAVALGVLSVLMILLPEISLPDGGNSAWIVVALVVPVCYGVESVYIAACWPRGLSSLQAVAGETFASALMMVPICLVFGDPIVKIGALSFSDIAITVFVLAGVVESLVYFYLIERTGGVLVSFGTFVSLFAGIVWGMLLFDERHAAIVWIAIAVLCMALYLAVRDRRSAA